MSRASDVLPKAQVVGAKTVDCSVGELDIDLSTVIQRRRGAGWNSDCSLICKEHPVQVFLDSTMGSSSCSSSMTLSPSDPVNIRKMPIGILPYRSLTYRSSTNSTSNFKVAPGGMTPPAPLSP